MQFVYHISTHSLRSLIKMSVVGGMCPANRNVIGRAFGPHQLKWHRNPGLHNQLQTEGRWSAPSSILDMWWHYHQTSFSSHSDVMCTIHRCGLRHLLNSVSYNTMACCDWNASEASSSQSHTPWNNCVVVINPDLHMVGVTSVLFS